MIKFQPLNLNGRILVIHANGKCLGELSNLEDGFYYWWPDPDRRGGCWDAYILREIADELDRLNKPWQDIVDVEMNRQLDAKEGAAFLDWEEQK